MKQISRLGLIFAIVLLGLNLISLLLFATLFKISVVPTLVLLVLSMPWITVIGAGIAKTDAPIFVVLALFAAGNILNIIIAYFVGHVIEKTLKRSKRA